MLQVDTKRSVLELVTAAGLRMSNGKPLSKQTLDKILKNELYAGWVVSEKCGVRTRGNHEPLVTDETFAAVQELVNGRRNALIPHRRNHPDFPLRGFVKCACCGRPMTGSWSTGRTKKYAYYRCQEGCSGSNTRKEVLEDAFTDRLDRLTARKEYVALFREVVLAEWKARKKVEADEAQAIKRRIGKLEGDRERVEEAFLFDRSITEETYKRQYERIRQDIILAEMDYHDRTLDALDIEGLVGFAENVMSAPARMWREASLDQKQRLQLALFPSGVTYGSCGIGTAKICLLFELLPDTEGQADELVRPEGLEPPTPGSEDRYSIQLSYGRILAPTERG